MYLYSAQYLHILQDSKRYLTNPTVQVQSQLTSNSHVVMQTVHHSHREEIGMQINFCTVKEITDLQLGHNIYLLCKKDPLAKTYFHCKLVTAGNFTKKYTLRPVRVIIHTMGCNSDLKNITIWQ